MNAAPHVCVACEGQTSEHSRAEPVPAQGGPGLAGITIVVARKAFASRPRGALAPQVTLGHPRRVAVARFVSLCVNCCRQRPLVLAAPRRWGQGLASCSARANGCFYFHFSADVVRVKRIEKGASMLKRRGRGIRGSRDSVPRNSGFWQLPRASLGRSGRHQTSLLPHPAGHCDIGAV